MNVLDDCLSKDLARDGGMTPAMMERVIEIASYAKGCGAKAIQFTCSAFGPAIDEASKKVGLPVLKPNEAMFDEALAICAGRKNARVGLLTTFEPATASMSEEWAEATANLKVKPEFVTACANGALEALNAGDASLHDQLVLARAKTLADCDVIMLGQFSMARSQSMVAEVIGKTVLSSPDSAVLKLKKMLQPSQD
jgi:aspartate/glutamate racemase